MVSGGAPRRDSSWLRYSAKELSQCDQWSFKSAAKPENRDGSSYSEIRSIAGICSMAPTSIRNKRFSMRLTQRAMLCKPAARPRSGLKIDRLQRGYSSQSGNQAASAAGVVQSARRGSIASLCAREPCARRGKRAEGVLLSTASGGSRVILPLRKTRPCVASWVTWANVIRRHDHASWQTR
jgi:hypothetical protein